MPKYRYVGTVASEVAIGDNIVPIGPGDFVTMSAEEYDTATENGLAFLDIDAKPPAEPKAETTVEGGEKA
jgi:hypothetical protein